MDYYEKRNQQTTLKIRKLLTELPDFLRELFLGISNTTSPLTRLNYAYDLRVFFDYLSQYELHKPINEITIDDLQYITATQIEYFLDYLNLYEFNGKTYKNDERGKSRKLSCVKTMFKYFYNKERITQNVAAKVSMPKLHEKPILRLENDEVNGVFDLVNEGCVTVKNNENETFTLSKQQEIFREITKIRDVAILTLFLGTGIRISELVGLDINDINLNNNSFTVTRKGGAKVILYFPNEVAVALDDYLTLRKNDNAADVRENALFLSIQHKRISVRAVENLVNKYCRIVSPLKKITPHKLRSTFGTNLYRATKDIYIVAEVLGHKDINTTKKHYAATSEDLRKQAAEMIKIKEDE